MHNISFKLFCGGGILGLARIEAGRVPHIDFVYFKAISKSNTFMTFDRN